MGDNPSIMLRLALQLYFIAALLVAPNVLSKKQSVEQDVQATKILNAVDCTPDRNKLAAIAEENEIFLLPGSGIYVWKINTTSDSAQLYFNQGINAYYGFHIIESLASFKKATKFDAENPMVWWGQALAHGPNINDVEYAASPDALNAAKKAVSLMKNATPLEKMLIKAMERRYSDDTSLTREVLNQRYVDAMKLVADEHPKSAEAQALFADAMMLQHPWDLWEVAGTPKPWTPAIRAALEKGLALETKHPGLNHYYIHVMEPSPYFNKALPSADILGSLTPGLAHMVHMPSHIYLRNGQFNKGAAINIEAVATYQNYQKLYSPVVGNPFIYEWHNRHMLVNCAMHAGRFKLAIGAARELQQAIDSASLFSPAPVGSLVQYIHMSPVLILTRFAQWDSLLAMEKPDDKLVYSNILYHFGKGMAQAHRNNHAEATKHLEELDKFMTNEDLKAPMYPFSSAIEGATTARELLAGIIYSKQHQHEKAIAHLTASAETEQKMVYNEPRDWFLNPHQYLGEAYMQANDLKKAEAAFRKDLTINEKNVWSLKGLLDVQLKQNKKKDANVTRKMLNEAASEADVSFR